MDIKLVRLSSQQWPCIYHQHIKKIGFQKSFTVWIKLLLNYRNHVFHDENATQYFRIEQGVRQSDWTAAYLFCFCLEILLIDSKNKAEIEGIEIFDCCYLHAAYADDSTFFLKGILKFVFFLYIKTLKK